MPRKREDYFYRKAKKEGYRSRASYKLQQINAKYNVIRPGNIVVDLGAAPGGWLQVAKEISGGFVVGIDIQEIEPIEGVETLLGNITDPSTLQKIQGMIEKMGGADVVICDASPNLSGNWSLDHARSIDLCNSALNIAIKTLKPGGNFVVKVFQGDMFSDFLAAVKKHFSFSKAYGPKASRKESAETYVIGKGLFRSPPVEHLS
ncbi:MAG: RlmE family RNA methyltransferase [Methanocellales archaeon]|nr:RlmE family RNA methyltransferase [Methanocellales archaeon]